MSEYCSPNDPHDHAGGKNAHELATEAHERCDARRRWHEQHPGQFMEGTDYQSVEKDYDAIHRSDKLWDFGGGGTVRPGEAFVCDEKEEEYGR